MQYHYLLQKIIGIFCIQVHMTQNSWTRVQKINVIFKNQNFYQKKADKYNFK